jgi:RNA polymerase sigma-B factor
VIAGQDTERGVGGDLERDDYGSPGPRSESDRPERGSGYDELEPVLLAYAATAPGERDRARLRERLVTGYLPLAHNIARRYANRGEPLEDLTQIASVGLIHAIDRYEPERGHHFLAYAIPTITGEIRRHFRDKTWAMRVPRRLKDLHVEISAAVRELSQQLGRAPRPTEIATRLNVPTDAVLEALAASESYKATSLDRLLSPGEGSSRDSTALGDRLGIPDPAFDLVTHSHALAPYLAVLPPRERAILRMRFFEGMTQTQIAEKIGISQMHVSRLLSNTLARLRDSVMTDQPATTVRPAPASDPSHRRM